MLAVLSPAKKLDFETPVKTKTFSIPDRMAESEKLIGKLKKMSKSKISALMSLSDNLAELNQRRYQAWQADFRPQNSKQALLAFKGDVYRGLDADSLSASDLKWADKHVRILSGLHGLLKPLDLIQPYRLEMSTKLPIGKAKNLYEFWGESLADNVNASLDKSKEKVLVNLASTEYFKAVKPKLLKHKVITADFWDFKVDRYKPIQLYLKIARGMMTRYMIDNKITKAEELKGFDREGYSFSAKDSTEVKWVFTRG
jgi:cytoplasmic iron level regulating protein YaaA (DUF328/UPF0246 family)